MNAIDKLITDSLNILRLSAGEQKKAIALFKKMQKELIAQLANEKLTAISKARAKKLLDESTKVINEYYANIKANLDDTLYGLSDHVATKAAAYISLDASLPTSSMLKSIVDDILILGTPAQDWWTKQATDTVFQFSAQVRQGLANSDTNQEIISRVKNSLQIPERNAASLVQTSVQSVANNARMEVFKANADIIKYVEQISTLDSHTSDICIAYSGAKWELDGTPIDGSPAFNGGLPRHFGCRSVLIPVTKSFAELAGKKITEQEAGTRASEFGQISSKTTFDDFLKRKTTEQQDEMLGKGRAELWRNGKITLSDLVNQQGRPLSLAELKKL